MNGHLQHKILFNVNKNETSECWLGTGQISNSGHGRIMIRNEDSSTRMERARNVSYMAFIDNIPKGFMTRQSCKDRLCVNPEHLELFDPDESRS